MTKAAPFNLGQTIGEAVALHRQGRLDDAERLYTRALKAQRDNFDALHLLGLLNHQRGKPGEAYRLISAALKVQPRSADALSNLALVLHALKRDGEALAALDKALAAAPDNIEALNNRGNILLELRRPAEALAAFGSVLANAPSHLQARVNRGNARTELGQAEEAIADYDTALTAAPGHPLALYNRGNALRKLGRDAEALADYERALAAAPNHVNALLNLGLTLAAMNRHQDAVARYRRLLALVPDHAEAHFSMGLALLTLGDYRAGLPEYEWRLKRPDAPARKDLRGPQWTGATPLEGKTILLHAEQGLGDTVMFCRYAPLLARAGAQVVLEAQAELRALLAGLEGVTSIVARGEPMPPHDLHCPLASLPLACGTELSSVPAEFPYLRASAAHVEKWRQRLQSLATPRIAVAWSGRATHINDRNRSLRLPELAPLLSANARFLGVQRDLRPADQELLARETRIVPLGEQLDDFADTAAVLSLCDLVISVDTSVAHVAGALGRPAFVLLPFQPDWRWTLDRDRSPWYPALRLFRQRAAGDWASVIGRVRGELAASFAA
jgi:tetratricopeptide (TPR) repeat protein